MHQHHVLFHHLLENLHQKMRGKYLPELTLFAALVGDEYSEERGLMVIGRAVNGWYENWTIDEMATKDGRNKYIKTVLCEEAAGKCPMSWVLDSRLKPGGYSTTRSAFWRVIERVTLGLHLGNEKTWPGHIAWSNLYKVSPGRGGNPPNRLCWAQLDSCVEVLLAELEEFRPRRVLALTGWNWFQHFKDGLDVSAKVSEGNLVEAVGTIGDAQLVVARHPQGKPETPMVEQILSHFGA